MTDTPPRGGVLGLLSRLLLADREQQHPEGSRVAAIVSGDAWEALAADLGVSAGKGLLISSILGVAVLRRDLGRTAVLLVREDPPDTGVGLDGPVILEY